MSDVAIRVNDLSKQYKIGSKQERYRTLRDTISEATLSPFRRVKGVLRGEPYSASGLHESIWALKDVSFEIKHGEVVGIIGRNGAGKSTLLKILSQITEPTTGTVDLYGRVGSLLEVGTGFHPELTGRENVYLNGAILGMTRGEIDRKFDEIVDFSGVEKFIDTPVKHYSSGMQLRLGFAVAAHLEPEILVVDEVLAVGDAEFQKKCLGKMSDVASEGRTVLFVSHNMGAIKRLCKSVILLSNGMVKSIGNSQKIIQSYLVAHSDISNHISLPPDKSKEMCLRDIKLTNDNGTEIIEMTEPFRVTVTYDVNKPINSAHVVCFFQTSDGISLFGTGDADNQLSRLEKRAVGQHCGTFEVPACLLNEGQYCISVSLGIPGQTPFARYENLICFNVVDNLSERRQWIHFKRPTLLGLELPWHYKKEPTDL